MAHLKGVKRSEAATDLSLAGSQRPTHTCLVTLQVNSPFFASLWQRPDTGQVGDYEGPHP